MGSRLISSCLCINRTAYQHRGEVLVVSSVVLVGVSCLMQETNDEQTPVSGVFFPVHLEEVRAKIIGYRLEIIRPCHKARNTASHANNGR